MAAVEMCHPGKDTGIQLTRMWIATGDSHPWHLACWVASCI